ncbi:Surface protein [Salmonella enterica subsp. enterica serovar Daytona]|uniref:Surface protein n=1 Tax=Salmonella enterica subsp. enterica serovar Daytona TaxID=1962639 RepID=A0A447JKD6_SALET|nr:Surface protein [Salmonella enterica subsp. enterica serovar Daytona]
MFSGLLIILVPLIVGYLIPLRHKAALQLINRLLSWIVYLILFFMGISLAFLDNLASNLVAIFHYSAVSITIILLCNIAALLWAGTYPPVASPSSAGKTAFAYCHGAGVAANCAA